MRKTQNELSSVAECIIHTLHNCKRRLTTKNQILKVLQTGLKKLGYRSLAIKDCFEVSADFDLIIKNGDAERYSTLKISCSRGYKDEKSAWRALQRLGNKEQKHFRYYTDIEKSYLLLCNSNKQVLYEELILGNDNNERRIRNSNPTRYTYLWENIMDLSGTSKSLYNGSLLGDIWNSNTYYVK